jgi:hypothetical protein
MSTTTAIPRRPSVQVGQRVELARYTVPAGERVIWGQRVDGVVRVTDCPARGRGRAYLVERELELDGNSALQALLTDYLQVADRLHEIPMASSPVDQYFEHLDQRRRGVMAQ